MKKSLYYLFVVILLGFVILGFFLNNKDNRGFYIDDSGNKLGCSKKIVRLDFGYDVIISYYDYDKNLIGKCNYYNGPGASGGNKDHCDSELLLSDPCIINETENCGLFGTYYRSPKYACSIRGT